ncbi:energy-coupling factor transporter transmembrane component T family protein [Aminomonas paucivorans]|uniref:energy-coupling factor transporter transmembrane component T family protein n=1 Tax=Aminomonas paucivorans TaxID=81412 RepID=UPI003317B1A9
MKFLNHLTLGQYVPTDSPIHHLDPRSKILSTLVLLSGVFGVEHPVAFAAWGGLLLGICALSRLHLRLVLGAARPVLWLLVFTALLHLLFTPGVPILTLGPVDVTREGVVLASRMGLRLLFLVLFAGLLTLTTSPMELADGMERLLSPLARFGFPAHEMAMMMTIALRFIPTLLDETDRILKAQLSRGANLDQGGFLRRIRAFVPVLVPLFVIVFQRAEDLATAMESRCYRGGVGRTRMNPLRWGRGETLGLTVSVGVVGALTLLDRWI